MNGGEIRPIREIEEPCNHRTAIALKMATIKSQTPDGTLMTAVHVEDLDYPADGTGQRLRYTTASRTETVWVPNIIGAGQLQLSGAVMSCILQGNRWYAVGIIGY